MRAKTYIAARPKPPLLPPPKGEGEGAAAAAPAAAAAGKGPAAAAVSEGQEVGEAAAPAVAGAGAGGEVVAATGAAGLEEAPAAAAAGQQQGGERRQEEAAPAGLTAAGAWARHRAANASVVRFLHMCVCIYIYTRLHNRAHI